MFTLANLVTWVAVGLIGGTLAGRIVTWQKAGFGLFSNLVLGCAGRDRRRRPVRNAEPAAEPRQGFDLGARSPRRLSRLDPGAGPALGLESLDEETGGGLG